MHLLCLFRSMTFGQQVWGGKRNAKASPVIYLSASHHTLPPPHPTTHTHTFIFTHTLHVQTPPDIDASCLTRSNTLGEVAEARRCQDDNEKSCAEYQLNARHCTKYFLHLSLCCYPPFYKERHFNSDN